MLRHRHLPLALVAALGAILSLSVFAAVRRAEEARLLARFEERVRDRAQAVQKSVDQAIEVLHFLERLYASSREVEDDEFRTFVAGALAHHPEIRAFEWAPRVPAAERGGFEAAARAGGLAGFAIRERSSGGEMVPAAARDEHFPVRFIVPLDPSDPALGFDLGSEAERRAVLERARDLGAPAATGRIHLVQGAPAKGLGCLVFQPIYRGGARAAGLDERRRDLQGFGVAVFSIDELIGASLGPGAAEASVVVLDATAPPEQRFLRYEGPAERRGELLALAVAPPAPSSPLPLVRAGVAVAGREWAIVARPAPEFLATAVRRDSWIGLAIGLAFTLLGTLYVRRERGRTALVERLVAERTGQLARAEAKHRALLDAVPDAMFRVRRDGIVVDIHERKALDPGDTSGSDRRMLSDAFAEEMARKLGTHVERALRTGELQIFECPLFRRGGEPGHYEVRVVRGGEDEALALVRDVTQRKEVERLKAEFVSTVSHELRTPLTSIRGSLGLIEGGVAGSVPAEVREMIRIARGNCDRLTRLINAILDLEKLATGRVALALEPVEAGELAALALEGIRGMADDAGVRLVASSAARGRVRADRDKIVQVLLNLVSNAIKFSPRGREVTVSAEDHAGRVRFSVRDEGRGIRDDELHKLFGRFQQVDGSDAREKGGSGLGLAISKAIVEHHGGEMGVHSVFGRGSTFWFELPGLEALTVPNVGPAR